MEDYKIEYNELLKRYNKGILYLQENPNMVSKWGNELQKIMQDIDILIKKYNIPEENILGGF